jgi:hypothetical protein
MSHVLVWIENAGRNVSKKQGIVDVYEIASKNFVNLSAVAPADALP